MIFIGFPCLDTRLLTTDSERKLTGHCVVEHAGNCQFSSSSSFSLLLFLSGLLSQL